MLQCQVILSKPFLGFELGFLQLKFRGMARFNDQSMSIHEAILSRIVKAQMTI